MSDKSWEPDLTLSLFHYARQGFDDDIKTNYSTTDYPGGLLRCDPHPQRTPNLFYPLKTRGTELTLTPSPTNLLPISLPLPIRSNTIAT